MSVCACERVFMCVCVFKAQLQSPKPEQCQQHVTVQHEKVRHKDSSLGQLSPRCLAPHCHRKGSVRLNFHFHPSQDQLWKSTKAHPFAEWKPQGSSPQARKGAQEDSSTDGEASQHSRREELKNRPPFEHTGTHSSHTTEETPTEGLFTSVSGIRRHRIPCRSSTIPVHPRLTTIVLVFRDRASPATLAGLELMGLKLPGTTPSPRITLIHTSFFPWPLGPRR